MFHGFQIERDCIEKNQKAWHIHRRAAQRMVNLAEVEGEKMKVDPWICGLECKQDRVTPLSFSM